MSSKGATGRHYLKLTPDILKLMMGAKKKAMSVFKGSFKTYTRYSRIGGKKQKKVVSEFSN